MCSMSKRLNTLYSTFSSDPDLILLEFAVNDYQGQDHIITVDHKTSVFFEGFEQLVLCAEVVIHSLLTKYPSVAIIFVEVQTAIVTRKSGSLLHLGVAMHYEIPVVSYAEMMFGPFYDLIYRLEEMDGVSYSFPEDMWNNASSTPPSAVLPYPHGCSACLSENIITQFRGGGCKSICTFVERSQIIHDRKLKCNSADIQQQQRHECFVPFLAHDAIHPSAVGHAIIADVIIDALAYTQWMVCQKDIIPEKQELPLTTFVARSFHELELRGDFLWVRDVDRVFSRWDELKPLPHMTTVGFRRYADDSLQQRPGWIATNENGGEQIVFPIDLPSGDDVCYVVYVAILRSYKGMGTMRVEVKDYGDKRDGGDVFVKKTSVKDVDGLWSSPISVWSDVQITVRPFKMQ